MISENDYSTLKDLAAHLHERASEVDAATFPRTHAELTAWVTLIYKIMKDYRHQLESM